MTAATTFQKRNRHRAEFGDSLAEVEANRPVIVAGIPAYNEEKNIAKVITSLTEYVDSVIVCDDGSADMTGKISRALGADVVTHEHNMGYGAAITSLFERAYEVGADVMVTIDGDGQHDPADLPKLTKPITEGEADIVIGSRFLEEDASKMVPAYRKLGIKAITKLSGGGASVTDAQSGLRAYSRRALKLARPSEMGMGASTEVLSNASSANLNVKEIPVKVSYFEDSSTHNPVYHGLDVILSNVKRLSIRHPLIFYGFPGLASLLVSLAFLWWDLSIFEESRRLVTNIALISLGMGVIGIVLMAVAVILWVLVSVIRERR